VDSFRILNLFCSVQVVQAELTLQNLGLLTSYYRGGIHLHEGTSAADIYRVVNINILLMNVL
jgi:hypothetical protein